MPQAGHNSGVTGDRLKSFVERIERLEEEKAALSGDIREVYAEAKSGGFDVKIVRALIRERKMTEQERREREELLETYRAALGDYADSPLGAAAMGRVR